MNTTLSTKYEHLNTITFYQKGFFQELLRVAMQESLISLKDGVQCRDLIFSCIAEACDQWIIDNEFDFKINIYREIFVKNHTDLLSIYLFDNMKPSEALEALMEVPAYKLHEKAVKSYEKRLMIYM